MAPRVTVFILALFLSLNSLAQKSYLELRDSILNAPKMQYRLMQDSIDANQEYFIRRNHVRIMVEKDEDSVDSTYYNEWGAAVRDAHYLNGKLFWTYTYKYDEFGNYTGMIGTFYDDGYRDNVYAHTFEYKVLPDGLREIEVQSIDNDSSFHEGALESAELGFTVTEYDAQYRKIRETEKNKESSCGDEHNERTRITTYTYDDSGNVVKKILMDDNACSMTDTFVSIMEYDKSNRLVSMKRTLNGRLDETSEYLYNSDGQTSYYKSTDYPDKREYISEDTYYGNGLEAQDEVTYRGETNMHEFSYAYYEKEKTIKKQRKK